MNGLPPRHTYYIIHCPSAFLLTSFITSFCHAEILQTPFARVILTKLLFSGICRSAGGSRPFSARGGPQYGAAAESAALFDASVQPPLFLPGKLISVPTLHLIGRVDGARLEGYRLASLCEPGTREVIEFDGGHAPPRKHVDLKKIGPAVERLLLRAGCAGRE